MQKVVSISLNGIAYQLEEPGYNLLRDYLERAELRLKDSPDRPEVMADLEQAIGEKCRATLGPHKTVVNTAEVERLIAEMGPVESPDGKGADSTFEGSGSTTGRQEKWWRSIVSAAKATSLSASVVTAGAVMTSRTRSCSNRVGFWPRAASQSRRETIPSSRCSESTTGT